MRPVDELEAVRILKRLTLHYPPPLTPHTAAESAARWDDWLGDLERERVPGDLLALACELWRSSSQPYFPTPGQLIDVLRLAVEARFLALERLEGLAELERHPPPAIDPPARLVAVENRGGVVIFDPAKMVAGIGQAGARRPANSE